MVDKQRSLRDVLGVAMSPIKALEVGPVVYRSILESEISKHQIQRSEILMSNTVGKTASMVSIPIDKISAIEDQISNIQLRLEPILKTKPDVPQGTVNEATGILPSEINRRLDQISDQLGKLYDLIDL